MKISKIVAFILGAAMLFALSSCEKEDKPAGLTLTDGVLMVGMEIGYPPFEYFDTDGKTPIGFDVQLGTALAAKLGLKVEFIDTAWDGIFAGVATSKYDCIMSSVTLTAERAEKYNFTKPYIGNAQSLVLLKNSNVTARTPEELDGLSVAYQAETTSDIYMTKLAAEKNLNFTVYEYDKVMNCYDDLKSGRVDAIVCDSLVAVDYVNADDSPFEIVWLGEADEVFSICIKQGNDALTAKLNEALDSLFADGTMVKISKDIFGVDMVSNVR